MRRIAAALCLLSLTALAAAQTADGPNLVQNPGFESPGPGAVPEGWSGSSAIYSRVTAPVRSGQAALQFVNADPDNYQLCTQQLPLKVGKAYESSVWVKTEGIQGEEMGATICLEWYGADEKYLGGSYPAGLRGTQDWTQVKDISGRVPAGAARCNVTCYVRRGMTGKAWFDDVEVRQWREPPLQTMLLQPNYRGLITADTRQVVVSARVTLDDFDLRPADVRLRGQLAAGPSGKAAVSAESAVIGAGGELRLPVRGLAAGGYELRVDLLKAATGETLGSDRWRLHVVGSEDVAGRAAHIDAANRLIADGKPFFPLGCYFGSINEDQLRTYADSAFNCLMPYGGANKEQMDLAQELGLKIIYSVKDAYFGSTYCPTEIKSEADEKPYIAERVAAYKDHPALLAWYLNDELSPEYMPRLEAHQQWLEELDPGHPTWVVLYQVGEVDQYRKTFDIIGTDPYPIPDRPVRMAGDWTKQTVAGVRDARPAWMVPQIFNWGVYQKDPERAKTMRPPTLPEMRSMAWQCLVHGAKGLIFYSFFDLFNDQQRPFVERWPQVKQMAAEIKPWTDILLTWEESTGLSTRDRDWLHWTTRAFGNTCFLFVVNDEGTAKQTYFRLPRQPRSVTLEGPTEEGSQTVRPGLRVKLEPFGVQVYKLVF